MRFLSVNHLRLGSTAAGIPKHLISDNRVFSTRAVWSRAVTAAIQHRVHAVVLSGETLAATNSGLEPWGPLVDGLADLHQAEIPVVAVPVGAFNPEYLSRFFIGEHVHWLTDMLDWHPPFTVRANQVHGPAVHIVSATLAEQPDAPVTNPTTLDQIDHPESIWLLTDPLLPDAIEGEHALVIEPGAAAPLSSNETGRLGAWLIDTDSRKAELIPLAALEFASVDIDISTANDLDAVEREVSSALVAAANRARNDRSMATTLLVDATITGSSRLYPALADTLTELEHMLVIEHDGVTIALSHIAIDATPQIELEPLLGRPDPVGELARLIHTLTTGADLTEAQSRLLVATEHKLMSVSHARVFGSILDHEPKTDAPTLLLRQGWATLDALVRQRGID